MKVAVIIPARNAAHLLPDCVAAVEAQHRPAEEIWIAVALSYDDTASVAARLADSRRAVHVLENAAGDRASGLNLVIGRTEAGLLAFVDAQATLAPDYLSLAVQVLAETDAAVVGGSMRPVGIGAIGQAMAAALQSPFGVGDSQFHFVGQAREVTSVYLGVYRSEVFSRIGLYNVALLRTEDDDLNARLVDDGMRIWLDPAIRSTYRCRETLGDIWRQYFGYGFWKVTLLAVRPGALRARHFVPLAFVDALLGGAVAALFGWWWGLFVVLVAWLLLAIMFAASSPAPSLAARLVFPVVTLTIHVAYGVGTMAGLLRLPWLAQRVRKAAVLAETARPR